MIINTQALLPAVIELAEQAALKILEIYETEFKIESKTDHTPVTTADLAANDLIVNGLKSLTPDFPIISEEAINTPFDERKNWPTYWLVDPLDGTREFIKKNGEFTVNIALIHNHNPILGVIYIPVTRNCYFASKGYGAFKSRKSRSAEKISTRIAQLSKLTIAGSRSYRDTSLDNYLKNIGKHTLICMGSSLKSCQVAEGLVDIYPRLGPTSEWDTAAAQCVVEEAGGLITDVNMKPLRYNTKESLLNPHFLVFGDDRIKWSKYI